MDSRPSAAAPRAGRHRLAESLPVPKRRGAPSIGWLALPGTGYLALVFALPLLLLLVRSFQGDDGWTLAGYTRFFGDSFSYTVLGNTLRIAAIVTALSLLIGYPTAFAMARASVGVQGLMFLALILPLSVGVIVKSFAWTILLRSNGPLNSLLLGLGVIDTPLQLLFKESGLVIASVHVFLPFMVLPIFTVARQIDSRLLDAASTLGASPWMRFRQVQWPLSLPGVVTGCAFVFSMAVSMYVIPSLLIGDRFQTLPALIARAYLFMRDRQSGSTLAVMLLLIAVIVVLGSGLLGRTLRKENQP
jgi:putative spermidine/putrescine transport system permease protein